MSPIHAYIIVAMLPMKVLWVRDIIYHTRIIYHHVIFDVYVYKAFDTRRSSHHASRNKASLLASLAFIDMKGCDYMSYQ